MKESLGDKLDWVKTGYDNFQCWLHRPMPAVEKIIGATSLALCIVLPCVFAPTIKKCLSENADISSQSPESYIKKPNLVIVDPGKVEEISKLVLKDNPFDESFFAKFSVTFTDGFLSDESQSQIRTLFAEMLICKEGDLIVEEVRPVGGSIDCYLFDLSLSDVATGRKLGTISVARNSEGFHFSLRHLSWEGESYNEDLDISDVFEVMPDGHALKVGTRIAHSVEKYRPSKQGDYFDFDSDSDSWSSFSFDIDPESALAVLNRYDIERHGVVEFSKGGRNEELNEVLLSKVERRPISAYSSTAVNAWRVTHLVNEEERNDVALFWDAQMKMKMKIKYALPGSCE
ncbi:MAG: hypothetical protein Q8P62_02920 [Candidatus Peregrinibacteria bacterium]|nr:hypothetical protein [Candidatus Peregrinibacteria bacterium]